MVLGVEATVLLVWSGSGGKVVHPFQVLDNVSWHPKQIDILLKCSKCDLYKLTCKTDHYHLECGVGETDSSKMGEMCEQLKLRTCGNPELDPQHTLGLNGGAKRGGLDQEANTHHRARSVLALNQQPRSNRKTVDMEATTQKLHTFLH